MEEIVLISCGVALFLLVWFDSDAFIEYATLFSGNSFFCIDDFRKVQEKYPALDWISYLEQYHDGFFIRLITCPLCLSFWLILAVCLLSHSLILLPICYILTLIIYKLTSKLLEW